MRAQDYIALDDAGQLAIEYRGTNLDMNAIAVIHLNLQAIAERVAEGISDNRHPIDKRTAFSPGINGRFEYTLNPIIRLVPSEIRVSSLFEYAIPLIPILADPDFRAAMQGVLGNIIFSIGNSTFQKYFSTKITGQPPQNSAPLIEVGANVAAIAVALAQNGPQGLIIRHKSPDGRITEVEITPNP